MRKPPYAGAAISEQHKADGKFGKHSYTRFPAAVQVSRPSTLRSLDEATAASALFRYDLIVWVAGPPGVSLPQPPEYGLNLAAPSSDEMLALYGGGS